MEDKKKNTVTGCIVLVVLIILIAVGMMVCTGDTTDTPSDLDLSANISYDGTQFTITNNDSYSWHNVTFELNDTYELHADYIAANTAYTVGAMQFAKSDGTMFNPFTQTALNIFISAENSSGTKGYYYGEWD